MRLVFDNPGMSQQYKDTLPDRASDAEIGLAAYELCVRANRTDIWGVPVMPEAGFEVEAGCWTRLTAVGEEWVDGRPLTEAQRPHAPIEVKA
jgi:hypothetical protein